MKSDPQPSPRVMRELNRAIGEQGWSVTVAAHYLDLTRPSLSMVLNGHRALSVDLALAFERVLKLSARDLLMMQIDDEIERRR